MNLLWVTSFNEEMYKASGAALLSTFIQNKVHGTMFMGTEGNHYLTNTDKYKLYDLDHDDFLQDWLIKNNDIIPVSLGGSMEPCSCKNPWARSEKEHKSRSCPHTWFNRNASRWFRKIATLRAALEFSKDQSRGITAIIWIDADCRFLNHVSNTFITRDLFNIGTEKEVDVLILKNRRTVLEGGFVGYNLACCRRSGKELLEELINLYLNGAFRNLYRYDDCYTLQKCIRRGYRSKDLCYKVDITNHSDVFKFSALAGLITHDKGKHGRLLGIMK